jgi:hypothetical protein
MKEQQRKLNGKPRGHDAYYGVTGNIRMRSRLRCEVARLWRKWLLRRNRGESLNWERFQEQAAGVSPVSGAYNSLQHAMKPQSRGTGCVNCARPDQWGASSGLRPGGPIPEAVLALVTAVTLTGVSPAAPAQDALGPALEQSNADPEILRVQENLEKAFRLAWLDFTPNLDIPGFSAEQFTGTMTAAGLLRAIYDEIQAVGQENPKISRPQEVEGFLKKAKVLMDDEPGGELGDTPQTIIFLNEMLNNPAIYRWLQLSLLAKNHMPDSHHEPDFWFFTPDDFKDQSPEDLITLVGKIAKDLGAPVPVMVINKRSAIEWLNAPALLELLLKKVDAMPEQARQDLYSKIGFIDPEFNRKQMTETQKAWLKRYLLDYFFGIKINGEPTTLAKRFRALLQWMLPLDTPHKREYSDVPGADLILAILRSMDLANQPGIDPAKHLLLLRQIEERPSQDGVDQLIAVTINLLASVFLPEKQFTLTVRKLDLEDRFVLPAVRTVLQTLFHNRLQKEMNRSGGKPMTQEQQTAILQGLWTWLVHPGSPYYNVRLIGFIRDALCEGLPGVPETTRIMLPRSTPVPPPAANHLKLSDLMFKTQLEAALAALPEGPERSVALRSIAEAFVPKAGDKYDLWISLMEALIPYGGSTISPLFNLNHESPLDSLVHTVSRDGTWANILTILRFYKAIVEEKMLPEWKKYPLKRSLGFNLSDRPKDLIEWLAKRHIKTPGEVALLLQLLRAGQPDYAPAELLDWAINEGAQNPNPLAFALLVEYTLEFYDPAKPRKYRSLFGLPLTNVVPPLEKIAEKEGPSGEMARRALEKIAEARKKAA